MRALLWPLLLATLIGCSRFPEVDAAISEQARRAAYPRLAPLDTLPAAARDPVAETTASDLSARQEALRRRADGLRATSLDAPG